MSRAKAIVFLLEGLNALACSYFGTYIFFHLQKTFGFGSRENLLVGAVHGFIYIFAAWRCGRFADRRGLLTSLKVGFAGMAVVLLLASATSTLTSLLLVFAAWTILMNFTWPALEAYASHGEERRGLLRMVGVYNCVWAGCGALAYFCGGAIFEQLGPRSIFWLPAVVHVLQFAVVLGLERDARAVRLAQAAAPPPPPAPEPVAFLQPVNTRAFLKMAWLANPFAYIAINTVLVVIPTRSVELGMTVTQAGIFWAVWLVVRLLCFVGLWQWIGWHYRFRWLLGAFVALIGAFAVLLLARDLGLLLAAQVIFGLATGLLYYSSLFYSMDAGDAKGEQGGIHEAAIGIGICLGPAIGAGALYLLPGQPHAGAWAVTGLLTIGLVILIVMRVRNR